MPARINIQTSDSKPSSGSREVNIIDHSTKNIIDKRKVDFLNGAAEFDSFIVEENEQVLIYAPENENFGISETAIVNEQTSSAWPDGPSVLHNVISFGQSLSIGEASTAENVDELFGGFLLVGIPANGKGDNTATTSEMASIVPFKNDAQESHGYGFINLFRKLQKDNSSENDPVLWNAAGVGGKTVDFLFTETGAAFKNFSFYITRSDSRAADINLLPSLPFWLWDQGESDTATDPSNYKLSLRSGHNSITSKATAETGQSNYPVIINGIGSGVSRREINNALYEYTEENQDAYYACNKWYINHKYPASEGDTTHLSAKGYMMQGEYHALAAHRYMKSKSLGDNPPISKCLQPESYSASGNSVTIAMNVPVPPMVIDTTTIPQLTGWGFKYISPTNVETLATSVNVSGNNLIVDFGVQLEEGGVLDFGYSDTQLGTPSLNVRDSQNIPSIVDGETLYNWFPVFYHTLEASEVA